MRGSFSTANPNENPLARPLIRLAKRVAIHLLPQGEKESHCIMPWVSIVKD